MTDYKNLEEMKSLNLQLKNLTVGLGENSKKTNKSAEIMSFLTFALVFFTFAQLYLAWQEHNYANEIINIKKTCFQETLNEVDSDIDYINCLRKNGFSE
ncbi:MAG: hypothetical protein QG583_111 [Patescibacteria group bacterium]|jgi:predicted ATPase|nr:hypothetical protein [Patescibacteria group bacterium]